MQLRGEHSSVGVTARLPQPRARGPPRAADTHCKLPGGDGERVWASLCVKFKCDSGMLFPDKADPGQHSVNLDAAEQIPSHHLLLTDLVSV